jgi:hypothetical protein
MIRYEEIVDMLRTKHPEKVAGMFLSKYSIERNNTISEVFRAQ